MKLKIEVTEEAVQMKITINVTADDIAAGIACNCFQCPISKAMHRQIPDLDWAEARHAALSFSQNGNRFSATPPSEARVFMEKFDNQDYVMPFSFEVTFKERV